jgi:hypothetical protein
LPAVALPYGQAVNGTLLGTVTDSAGAVVPVVAESVNVVLKSPPSSLPPSAIALDKVPLRLYDEKLSSLIWSEW